MNKIIVLLFITRLYFRSSVC